MGLIQDGRLGIRALLSTAIAASAIAVAGCGGGGDDNTATATGAAANLPTVTSPRFSNPNGSETRPQATSPTSTSPNGATPPARGPAGFERRLAPFRDCLTRHGVDPGQFRQNFRQGAQGQPQQPNPAQRQKNIQAAISCIPSLPPRLRAGAQRLAQRYEQRNG